MSSAFTVTKDSFANGYKYIASQAYNGQIFTYTTSLNAANVQTGTLAAVTGLSSNACPPGSILVETGKKLYVGVHPSISTFMTYVVDTTSRLGGFIDPQAPCFSRFDGSQPLFLGNSNDNNPVNQQVDLGNSVYTNGNITTNSYMNATVQTLPLFIDAGFPQGTGANTFSTYNGATSTAGAVYLNPFAGNNFKITVLPAQSSLSTLYVYMRNPSTPTVAMTSTPSGQQLTVLVNVSTGLVGPASAGPNVVLVGNLSTGIRVAGSAYTNGGTTLFTFLSTTRTAMWQGITDGTQAYHSLSNTLL